MSAQESQLPKPRAIELSAFDPYDKLIDIKGKDYLEAKWRIFWFRDAFPNGTIETELVHLDMEKKRAVARAVVVAIDEKGKEVGRATGHKIGEPRGKIAGFVELAETGAIARALAGLGFGTQFVTDEYETTDDPELADAPVERAEETAPKADPKPAAKKGLKSEPTPIREPEPRETDDDPLIEEGFAEEIKARCKAAERDGLISRNQVTELILKVSDGAVNKIDALTMSEGVTLGIELDELLSSGDD